MSKITRLSQHKWRSRKIRYVDIVTEFIDKNRRELSSFEEKWLGIECLLVRLLDKNRGEIDSIMILEYLTSVKLGDEKDGQNFLMRRYDELLVCSHQGRYCPPVGVSNFLAPARFFVGSLAAIVMLFSCSETPWALDDTPMVKRGLAASCVRVSTPIREKKNYISQYDHNIKYTQKIRNICPEHINLHYCRSNGCGQGPTYFTDVRRMRSFSSTNIEFQVPVSALQPDNSGRFNFSVAGISYLACYSDRTGRIPRPGLWNSSDTCNNSSNQSSSLEQKNVTKTTITPDVVQHTTEEKNSQSYTRPDECFNHQLNSYNMSDKPGLVEELTISLKFLNRCRRDIVVQYCISQSHGHVTHLTVFWPPLTLHWKNLWKTGEKKTIYMKAGDEIEVPSQLYTSVLSDKDAREYALNYVVNWGDDGQRLSLECPPPQQAKQ